MDFIPYGIAALVIVVIGLRFRPSTLTMTNAEAVVVNSGDSVDVFFNRTKVRRGDVWEFVDLSITTIEIDRRGLEGIHCRDNIRVDMVAQFQISIRREPKAILEVAEKVGCERAADTSTLDELFVSKFGQSLKVAAKKFDFDELMSDRPKYLAEVKSIVGQDLYGYELHQISLDHLKQTPLETLNPENILDAEGITLITCHVATNKFRRWAEKAVAAETGEVDQAVIDRADEIAAQLIARAKVPK